MSQLKVNALVSYSGNTVTLGTSGDTINVASGVTFNTASATVNLPTTIKVSTIQNTNSTNLITQTNVTTITFGATSQTISVPSVASFASTIGVGGATPSSSGAGITFPATQSDSSNANTLDDYEEGTFIPTITGTTAAGTFTPNSSYTYGRYTKIGRIVHIYFGLVYSSFTGTGNIQLGGLPFTSQDEYTDAPFWVGGTSVVKPANTVIYGRLLRNATTCQLLTTSTSGTTNDPSALAVDAAGELYFNLTYNV